MAHSPGGLGMVQYSPAQAPTHPPSIPDWSGNHWTEDKPIRFSLSLSLSVSQEVGTEAEILECLLSAQRGEHMKR